MAYKHGIYPREVPTKVVPPNLATVGLPVVFGTAPINMGNLKNVNKPVLCFKYEDAVKEFGFSVNWDKYTLSEFIYSQFVLYNMAPVVLINVLDPKIHKRTVEDKEINLIKGAIKLEEGILHNTLKVFDKDKRLNVDEDYLLSFDNDGSLDLVLINDEIKENATLKVSYDVLDPTKVSEQDIIGGINVSDGSKTGLELISEIFPRFREVPGLILAPGFSENAEVSAIMSAKASNINGVFKAESIIDAPSNINYTEIPEWKNKNNIMNTNQFLCWPKLKLDKKIFNFSTQLAGVINRTDFNNNNIPYVSPSNERIECTAPILYDKNSNEEKEIFLGMDEANYLNGNGILTALNFIGGWKAWGNRTAIYPGNTDPKDSFIPIRRMFNWISNTLVLTHWTRIDSPTNRRLIETLVDSANLWMNSLVADQYLLGGRIEFQIDENPEIDVMDGILKFHIYITPPSPARQIDFIQEYDVNYVTDFINSIVS